MHIAGFNRKMYALKIQIVQNIRFSISLLYLVLSVQDQLPERLVDHGVEER